MSKEEQTGYRFKWEDLGDIALGRPNLGDTTKVAVYRLMQYTLRDVLATRYGQETASDILREAGKLTAGQVEREPVVSMQIRLEKGPNERK